MKNVLVFISPIKKFIGDTPTTIKIQIDNSLDLGWKKGDIILATNFEYEYNGVKSIEVSDDNLVVFDKPASKHKAILELFKRGLINKGELYWFHDLDAFQSEVITNSELKMNKADMALTDYGWRGKWSTGSLFFKSTAEDIFERLVQTQNLLKTREEETFAILMNRSTSDPGIIKTIPVIKDIKKRIKKINTSYNFVPLFRTRYCYAIATKPIKVVHFHPFAHLQTPSTPSALRFFMYGENEIKTVFMSERLKNIFHDHGIK